ncbi:aromatic-L-amino-acid decarboxylase-like [Mobula hypostoma]|uniref:aromatic-L-amino-acid decarboxylase-like n=1 Tax=Mobula hypostoma TaxID=723540 RepID=UPI002FC33354
MDGTAHSFERAGLIGGIKLKKLSTNQKFSLHGGTLKQALDEDKPLDLIPFWKRMRKSEDFQSFLHWKVPLGSRFHSLKMWFVFWLYGVKGIQEYIRRNMALAHEFASLVHQDKWFEVIGDVVLGLVCFRMKKNERLIKKINSMRKMHIVSYHLQEKFALCFAISSETIKSKELQCTWEHVQEVATHLQVGHE